MLVAGLKTGLLAEVVFCFLCFCFMEGALDCRGAPWVALVLVRVCPTAAAATAGGMGMYVALEAGELSLRRVAEEVVGTWGCRREEWNSVDLLGGALSTVRMPADRPIQGWESRDGMDSLGPSSAPTPISLGVEVASLPTLDLR